MSAQPSNSVQRVRWGLRWGTLDYVDDEAVVVYFDDGESIMFDRKGLSDAPSAEELVWL